VERILSNCLQIERFCSTARSSASSAMRKAQESANGPEREREKLCVACGEIELIRFYQFVLYSLKWRTLSNESPQACSLLNPEPNNNNSNNSTTTTTTRKLCLVTSFKCDIEFAEWKHPAGPKQKGRTGSNGSPAAIDLEIELPASRV